MTRPGVPSGKIQNKDFAMGPRLKRVFEARWLIKVGTPYTWGHKLIEVGTPETAKCTNISGVPKNYGTLKCTVYQLFLSPAPCSERSSKVFNEKALVKP